MAGIKRVCSKVECGSCGNIFMQTRWWQAFCSNECRKSVERLAKRQVKELQMEVLELRKQLKEMQDNALDHSLRSEGVRTGQTLSQAWDVQNQEDGW